MLTFDDPTHTYQWNGVQVPGVTTIIGQFVEANIYGAEYYVDTFTGSAVAKEVFATAADHGTAVHNAVHYYLTCGVDWDSLHSDIADALNQFIAWKDEYVQEIHVVEEPMYSVKYNYAGTPDIICTLKRKYGGKRAVVDIKTGAHGMAGVQLGAYDHLDTEVNKFRGRKERYVLKLPKDGSDFKFIPETNRGDFRFFLNKLAVYNFMKGR